jgi:hypothetical protein
MTGSDFPPIGSQLRSRRIVAPILKKFAKIASQFTAIATQFSLIPSYLSCISPNLSSIRTKLSSFNWTDTSSLRHGCLRREDNHRSHE